MGMIITVDGPSGAGKGTLCYALLCVVMRWLKSWAMLFIILL